MRWNDLSGFLTGIFSGLAGLRGARGEKPTSTRKRLFVMSLIAINFISSVLILSIYTLVRTRLQSEARTTYVSIVHQASREVETFIRNCLLYLGPLSMDEQVQDLMQASATGQLEDRVRLLRIQQALKRLKVNDQDIHSVYFLRFQPQLLITDRGIYADASSFADGELFAGLAAANTAAFSQYKILFRNLAPHYATGGTESTDVLTLVLPINNPDSRGALVLNLQVAWFRAMFARTLGSLAGSTCLLLPDGRLVASTDTPAHPPTMLPPEESDVRYEGGAGFQRLVFSARGQYGLALVHSVPRDVIYRGAFIVRNVLIILWVTIFLVSLSVASRISTLASRPIERLYSFLRDNHYIPADSSVRGEVESLMQAYRRIADTNLIYRRQLSHYRPLFNEMLLMNVLGGKDDPTLSSSNYRRTYLSTFKNPPYYCCILEVGGSPPTSRTRAMDRRGDDSALIVQTIERYLPRAKVVSHILEDRIVVVCSAEALAASDFQTLAGRMNEEITLRLGCAATWAVGTCARTIGELPTAYRTAEIAMEQKFIRGVGQLLDYQDIPQEATNEPRVSETIRKMQAAVKALNLEQSTECLARVLSLIAPRHHVREAFTVLSSRILSALADIAEKSRLEVPGPDELSEIVQRSETLSDLTGWLQAVVKSVFQQLELAKRQKRNEFLGRVQTLIDQQHANSLLQIADIAGAFHLSPAYFGRIFSEITGKSFTAYVNEVRLQHAASRLERSGDSVIEIAEKAGFNSTQYFIRVFKRKYGLTPGSFRSRAARPGDAARAATGA